MKPANFSPIFASMYCGLCSVARDHGYALTVHGTMSLDFDVVAIPWTEEAVEPQELVDALSNLMNLCAGELFEGVPLSLKLNLMVALLGFYSSVVAHR